MKKKTFLTLIILNFFLLNIKLIYAKKLINKIEIIIDNDLIFKNEIDSLIKINKITKNKFLININQNKLNNRKKIINNLIKNEILFRLIFPDKIILQKNEFNEILDNITSSNINNKKKLINFLTLNKINITLFINTIKKSYLLNQFIKQQLKNISKQNLIKKNNIKNQILKLNKLKVKIGKKINITKFTYSYKENIKKEKTNKIFIINNKKINSNLIKKENFYFNIFKFKQINDNLNNKIPKNILNSLIKNKEKIIIDNIKKNIFWFKINNTKDINKIFNIPSYIKIIYINIKKNKQKKIQKKINNIIKRIIKKNEIINNSYIKNIYMNWINWKILKKEIKDWIIYSNKETKFNLFESKNNYFLIKILKKKNIQWDDINKNQNIILNKINNKQLKNDINNFIEKNKKKIFIKKLI